MLTCLRFGALEVKVKKLEKTQNPTFGNSGRRARVEAVGMVT